MMRFFNKVDKNEYLNIEGLDESELPTHIVVLPDDSVFWSQIPEGKALDFDDDDLPFLIDYVEPPKTESIVRSLRDELLNSSDFTQLADSPANAIAWEEYRESLRDVPEQVGFPEDVIWPVEPVA